MTSQTQTTPTKTPRRSPVGWPEMLVGLVGLFLTVVVTVALAAQFDLDPVPLGVLLAALSGIAGAAGFAIAAAIRVRRLEPFGVVRTPGRWLLIGLLGGILAIVLKFIVIPPLAELFGLATDTQASYQDAASGGAAALALTAIGLVILTPLGEELLFRGVITTGLLRYGPVVATVLSAAVFSLAHGINVVLPIAFIVGVIAAELRRRSGSIWPGFIVHAVHNVPTVVVYALM